MKRRSLAKANSRGFSLVELLLSVAIIGIMSALIISSVSNAARDSRTVMARQQQVVLQQALNSWIAAASSGTNSMASTQTAYGNAATATAKLALLRDYLQDSTYAQFLSNSTTSQIRSEAMISIGAYLQFSAWNATNYPTVQMIQ
jgi:prepilin-type N-terminal cleavage/methylation domain-containing protein